MAIPTPYAYYQCPCSDQADSASSDTASHSNDNAVRDDERTFDPRSPRSNFSLFPLDHLTYCEDCHEIRCPRCVNEEIVTFFCPSCLMECPVCVAPVQVTQLPSKADPGLLDAETTAATQPAFALACSHCSWSSSEVGIELDRPSGIHKQLSKIKNGGARRITAKDIKERRKADPELPRFPDDQMDAEMQFAMLKSFYQTQLLKSKSSMEGGPGGNSSPAAITRIMSMYTAGGRGIDRRNQDPPDVMRESLHTEEGLRLEKLDEEEGIAKLMAEGWQGTLSREQRLLQPTSVHFQDEIRPVATLLRTKRSKRCPACRHIITKPENKVISTHFKIRLVAKSYIPTITIKPLNPTAKSVPVLLRPMQQQEEPLKPLTTYHYVVTFKNPLFESVKVTLAAPNKTPGRFASTVTVLCPAFEIDANMDMWDEALQEDEEKDPKRKNEESNGQVVTGKIWERGRNWVSIIVEVIPPSLRTEHLSMAAKPGETVDDSPLREGEDILEIPMFVRMEWEQQVEDVGSAAGKDKDAKEKRELAYWSVLGVGRIGND